MVLWSVPETNSKLDDTITIQYGTLPVSFPCGLWPNSQNKSIFWNASEKKTVFCIETLEVLRWFLSVLQLISLLTRALALAQRKKSKCQKLMFCAGTALKTALFQKKVGTEYSQQFPTEYFLAKRKISDLPDMGSHTFFHFYLLIQTS